jgi:ABC-2 type transport system permease protein
MLALLKIEWLKIKNYTAFIVLGLFFVLGVAGINYAAYIIKKNVIDTSDPTGLISSASPYDFTHTWQTTSYIAGWLLLLPGMLLILLVTNEFSYRTHRQNILDGWARKDFFNVKLALVVITALISTILVFLTALIFGLASGTSFSFEHVDSVGYFFLKALSYNMIALLFSVLIRKTGFAIGLFFVYMGFENIISGMLQGLSYYLKVNNDFDIGNMGDYLPMNASDALLKFPQNAITDLAKNAPGIPGNYTYVILGLAIFYLVIFYLWSRSRIIKTDL